MSWRWLGLITEAARPPRRTGPCADCALKDREIVGNAEIAEAREVLRAKWEQMYRAKCVEFAKLHTRTDDAERKLREVEADLWMRDGQIENQAAQIVALEADAAEANNQIAALQAELVRDLDERVNRRLAARKVTP